MQEENEKKEEKIIKDKSDFVRLNCIWGNTWIIIIIKLQFHSTPFMFFEEHLNLAQLRKYIFSEFYVKKQ